ncbi:hypothetical protein DVH24_025358 [Malus domestica]|uniref:Uncharacterized protein n=1 Tax=Malus domestica TaxID=3750 RepID=A0A498HQZ2_MALDO|nr:hypothetical protein DVH24_025358 [Malus domestica]
MVWRPCAPSRGSTEMTSMDHLYLIGTSRAYPLLFFSSPICFGSMPFYRRTMDMAVEVSGMLLSRGVEMLRENHHMSGERGSLRGF